MINIGDFNKARVLRKVDFGYFLETDINKDVLLPKSNLDGKTLEIDEELDVFIYRDSKDKLIATLKAPLAKVGETAYLKVVSNTPIGSFIDFGLDRDILVPMRERTYRLDEGKQYLFYIYLDKSSRLAATTDADAHLLTDHNYNVGDMVKGVVYGFQSNNSVMVAVDAKYKGVILHNEYFSDVKIGDELDLRVIKIYDEDNKLGLTPRKTTEETVDALQADILDYLKSHDGFMKYNDKTDSEEIARTFSVSKKQFKRTLGNLMKQGIITQDSNGTTLIQK